MNPEEKDLLEKSLRLSEENNRILRNMERAARWATLWGFIKLLIIVIPLVIGYIFLQPYFGPARDLLETSQSDKNFIERFITSG